YSRECWWSGCQPYSWAQRGCFPANDWEQVKSENCGSGDKYYCCRRGSGGGGNNGGGNGGGGNSGNRFINFDEFVRAVTVHGYPGPGHDKYNALTSQAHSAGGISSKQELAMFLTQILHESGGLVHKKEIACRQTGCPGVYDSSVGAPGRNYYGRGYIQLSHSYNYKAASQDLFGDLRLIENPDLVSDDENVAWATALWYWRTRVRNQPNVLNFWFGATTNAINGALECRGAFQHLARKRFDMYRKVLQAFSIHANPIERGCYN
ncbi:hypothetical protein B4U80_04272, partial [Leptotrombidium deliense]